MSKSKGPCSISSKILNVLKNDIFEQLADLLNLAFITGTFPTLLKTAKVIPIHKIDFKLDFTNYYPTTRLANYGKILEKLMHSRLSTFSNIKDIIYPLQFGFCQNYSTSYTLFILLKLVKKHWIRVSMAVGFLLIFQRLLILLTIIFYLVN